MNHLFFFNDTATTEIYTLSLHDALPISNTALGADLLLDPDDLETTFAPGRNFANKLWNIAQFVLTQLPKDVPAIEAVDRKSTRLNSSHLGISYAVFCLEKKINVIGSSLS